MDKIDETYILYKIDNKFYIEINNELIEINKDVYEVFNNSKLIEYREQNEIRRHLDKNEYTDEQLFKKNNSISDNIYKGEHDGEDLSRFKDETIESYLRDKIFDSTITIVLISPNMKDRFTPESEQWIPWEISYSLKNPKRNGRTSSTNGIICVVLPDINNSYNYYLKKDIYGQTTGYNDYVTFDIIKKNRNNLKHGYLFRKDYIITVTWNEFISNMSKYIQYASEQQVREDYYTISKLV